MSSGWRSLHDRFVAEREARARQTETEVRAALGRWVSEIEPDIIIERDHAGRQRFVGLAAAGTRAISVYADEERSRGR